MEVSPEGIIAYIAEYTRALPSAIMHGDIFALTISLIAFFIAVIIINKLTTLLILFLKKAILLIIVAFAFFQFLVMFWARVVADGWTADTIIFGTAGIAIGLVAIVTAVMVAFGSFRDAQRMPADKHSRNNGVVHDDAMPVPPEARGGLPSIIPAPPAGTPPAAEDPVTEGRTFLSITQGFSIDNLKNDRSLGTVIAYLVVAQFGVFSTISIPAPSFYVGFALFILFIFAGLIFIHFTYSNYVTGLRHLFVGVVVGTFVAVLLGYFWGNIPPALLLSPAFFQTNALVALVTGLALSLFIGGRG